MKDTFDPKEYIGALKAFGRQTYLYDYTWTPKPTATDCLLTITTVYINAYLDYTWLHYCPRIYTRRSSRVFIEGAGDDRADHAHPTRTAVPCPGVCRVPGVRENEKSAKFEVNIVSWWQNYKIRYIKIWLAEHLFDNLLL